MPRWETDAGGRLLTAAMELFLDRGYDDVTVAEIAERAGLTKRSFFRHFADKREVLFGGAARFEQAVVAGVVEAPASVRPMAAVLSGLAGAGAMLTSWGEPVRLRQRVVDSAPELQERELIKFASLATRLTAALTGRGVEELTARLVVRAGLAAFTTAFERWLTEPGDRPFPELLEDTADRLREAVGVRDDRTQVS